MLSGLPSPSLPEDYYFTTFTKDFILISDLTFLCFQVYSVHQSKYYYSSINYKFNKEKTLYEITIYKLLEYVRSEEQNLVQVKKLKTVISLVTALTKSSQLERDGLPSEGWGLDQSISMQFCKCFTRPWNMAISQYTVTGKKKY